MSRTPLGASTAPPTTLLMLSALTDDMWVHDSIPQFEPGYRFEEFTNTTRRRPKSNMQFIGSAPAKLGSTSLPDVQSTCPTTTNFDGMERMRSIPPVVLAVWRHMEKHRDGRCLNAGTMNKFFAASNRTNSENLKIALAAQKFSPNIVDGKKVEMEQSVPYLTKLSNTGSSDMNSTCSTSAPSHSEFGWFREISCKPFDA